MKRELAVTSPRPRRSRRRMLLRIAVISASACLGTIVSAVSAQGSAQVFPLPGGVSSGFVAPGADGRIWYPLANATTSSGGGFGRMSPTGAADLLPLSTGVLNGMTRGPDGNIWYVSNRDSSSGQRMPSVVGRVTPAGETAEFAVGPSILENIVTAGDGALWSIDREHPRIVRVTVGGEITFLPLPDGAGAQAGADGNVWFRTARGLGYITPSGSRKTYDISGFVGVFAPGPDGAMWFIHSPSETNRRFSLERIDAAGHIGLVTRLPFGYDPAGWVVAKDGNLWMAQGTVGTTKYIPVARITPGGHYTGYCGHGTAGAPRNGPTAITLGPDDALWYPVDTDPPEIGRITTDTPPGPTCQPAGYPKVPRLGNSVTLGAISGSIRMRGRGARAFTRLRGLETVGVGAELDASRGRVAVTSAVDRRGSVQTARVSGGRFVVRQGRGTGGLTTLRLSGPMACPSASATASRRLSVVAGGRFRSLGRYATATAGAGNWTMKDTCTATTTSVRRGSVTVRDLATQTTITVTAGHSVTSRGRRLPT